MNEKLRMIINHYGIRNQLKHFQSEVYELTEAILIRKNIGIIESIIEGIKQTLVMSSGLEYTDSKKEHIKEEIADVMVMLKQFQLYYNISSDEIKEVMKCKVERQIERINNEGNKV